MLAALARGGIEARVVPGDAGVADEQSIRIPLDGRRALVLERAEDLRAALALLAAERWMREKGEGRQGTLLRLLRGEIEPGAPIAIDEMAEALERCVILIRGEGDARQLLRTLEEIFPPGEQDELLSMPDGRVALVKQTRDMGVQEIGELCEAVAETVLGEIGQNVTIGAGESVKQLGQLGQSCRQAEEAVRVGLLHYPEQRVFLHGKLVLERLLQQIPEATRAQFAALIFHKRNSRLLNEEMLLTIERFCECNLNLAEAARQLYIHRNTLIYRLDKLQKATGLDIRRFGDAVLCTILRMLKDGEGKAGCT